MTNDPRDRRPAPNSNQRPSAAGQRPAGTRFRTDTSASGPASQPGSRVRPVQPQAGAQRPAASGQRPAGTRFAGSQQAPRTAQRASQQPQRVGQVTPPSSASPYARTPQRPQKKSSPLPVIIAIVLALAVVGGVAVFVFPAIFGTAGQTTPAVEPGQDVTLNIPEGASGDTIASILSENHVIENPKDYYAAVKQLEADMSLKPGDYAFVTGQDPIEVVKQLVAGPNIESLKLTVPEGKTVTQTAAIVEDIYGIPTDTFVEQAKASTYVADYPFLEGVANDSLEGFLFPKTYTFSGTPTADDVIRAMLDQYQIDVLDALDFDAARALIKERYGIDMTDYQLLNLASIVEREGLNAEQRAHVASVFFNRLAGKMPGGLLYLNSDATLMYVTGGEVTASDIESIDSPYNSYKYGGLPPTPICAPSVESINATLNPLDTNDLYFFITMDEEYFSETYEEHQQSW